MDPFVGLEMVVKLLLVAVPDFVGIREVAVGILDIFNLASKAFSYRS